MYSPKVFVLCRVASRRPKPAAPQAFYLRASRCPKTLCRPYCPHVAGNLSTVFPGDARFGFRVGALGFRVSEIYISTLATMNYLIRRHNHLTTTADSNLGVRVPMPPGPTPIEIQLLRAVSDRRHRRERFGYQHCNVGGETTLAARSCYCELRAAVGWTAGQPRDRPKLLRMAMPMATATTPLRTNRPTLAVNEQ